MKFLKILNLKKLFTNSGIVILLCIVVKTNYAQVEPPQTPRDKCFSIPVVVHIIHLPTDLYGQGSNISDEQVASQFEVFNQDFNALNTDIDNVILEYQSLVADFQMSFNLVETIRVPSDAIINNIGAAQVISPKSSVNLNYLHIWVVFNYSSDADGQSCNPNGLYMPGTNCEVSDPLCNGTDGILIEFDRFGKCHNTRAGFRNGRTMTHEVGHWLGLLHTNQLFIQGGAFRDDCIADTPCNSSTTGGGNSCVGPKYNCIDFAGNLHSNVTPMLQNYMLLKFNSSACNIFFTKGQKAIAQSNLAYNRPEFLVDCKGSADSKKLILNSGPCPIISIPQEPYPDKETLDLFPTPTKNILNYNLNSSWLGEINVSIINSKGIEVFTQQANKTDAKLEGEISVQKLPFGIYTINFTDGINRIQKSFIVSE
jgi:hypothetical protein